MKANELMIGDWVLINGTPMQIQAINDIDGEIMAGDELYCLIEDRVHSEDKIEPIPLTKEILEKNGVEDFDCSFHFPEDDCLWLELNWEEDGLKWTVNCNEYDILPLDYVHELQHALKLCGIDKEIVYG